MTRDSSAAAVYLALIAVALGPFALSATYAAHWLWLWFLAPGLRFLPTPLQFYVVFAAYGIFRTARYVQNGQFRWKDAIFGSILAPLLLLLAGFLAHLALYRG
jgi:hypothetical protein